MTTQSKAPKVLRKAKGNDRVMRDVNSHVPDISAYDNHITRTVNGMTEYDMFDYAIENKLNVLIEGPSGCGKTSASLAYAAREGMPFYSISSNIGIDPSQLFGRYIPDEVNGGFRWVDGPVTSIIRNGGVLLLNEVNFLPERVSTVLFGLLDKRREITLLDHESETIKAHENVLVVADMNPGYEGTRPLNKAFRNRFAIQMSWGYSKKVESKLVDSGTLLKMAQDVRRRSLQGEFDTPVGTNMLIEFEALARGLGYPFAVSNFVNHFHEGERQSIQILLENTYQANIKRELGLDATIESDTVKSKYPSDHPIWKQRALMKDGEVDEEFGILGIDWRM